MFRFAASALARAGGAVAVVTAALALSAAPGAAQKWEVHNNANRLSAVAVLEPDVWAPSLDGLHRFDRSTRRFERFFREPGRLVSNATVAVTRDAAGRIWIGTDGSGVSLLQPSGTWRTLTAFDGLPSDSVLALEPFEDGVWIGTGRGLAFFVGTEVVALWPDGVNPSPFASNRIQDVEVFGGRTWVATANGVYTTVDGVSWTAVNSGLATLDVRSLAHDGTALWAVTAAGVVWSGGESGAWVRDDAGLGGAAGRRLGTRAGALYLGASSGVFRRDPGAWTPLAGPVNADVDVADDGTVWAGADNGLWRWNGASWVNFRSPGPIGNWVHGLSLDGESVCIATRFNGASCYDDARGWRNFLAGAQPDTSLISNDFLFACFVDREGFKWFGDWNGSIARLDDSGPTPRYTHFFYNVANDSSRLTLAWASAQDPQGSVWFGLDTTCGGCGPEFDPLGLMRIDADGTRTNYTPTNSAMSGNQPRAIAFAPNGTVWVGYRDAGVDVFADRNLQVRLHRITAGINGLQTDNVWAIRFHGDQAWILTDGSATRFNTSGTPQRQEIVFLPPVSQNGAVHPLFVQGDGSLWIATQNGLFWRPAGGSVRFFNTQNSPLVSDDVHSVAVTPSGAVWIGTGAGLNRLFPGGDGGVAPSPDRAFRVTPNPVRLSAAAQTLVFRDADGEPMVRTDVEILDLAGRVLTRLRTDGDGNLQWRARSSGGRALRPGVYFLRAIGFDDDGRRTAIGRGRLVLLP